MSHGSVLIGTSEIRSQAQESGRYTPDPFPRERVGSGNETSLSETHMMRSTGILSVCHAHVCFVRTFTFRIYSCSNSTITHAQTSVQKFSHCVRVAIIVRVRVSEFDEYEVHGFAFENKNKPVSPPIVVTMCTAMLRLAP